MLPSFTVPTATTLLAFSSASSACDGSCDSSDERSTPAALAPLVRSSLIHDLPDGSVSENSGELT